MAISDTITSMYDNVENVYDVLELAGADLTNVDKNILNLKQTWEERLLYFLANGLDVVWNNWNKITGSGTSLTLNNTIQAPMKIVYGGNTYQYSTTGKNLVDFDNYTSLYNATYDSTTKVLTSNTLTGDWTGMGINNYNTPTKVNVGANIYYYSVDIRIKSGTYNSNVNHFANGDAIPNVSRTVEAIQNPTLSSSFQRYIFKITYTNNSGSDTQTTSNFIQLKTGANNAVIEAKNFMISTTNGDYEPYTNGASPNPDYPQDIHVVSGDNTIKVEGKNLCDETIRQGSWNNLTTTNRVFTASELYLKAGETFTFKTNLDLSVYKYGILVNDSSYPATTLNASVDSGWLSTNTYTFNTTRDGYFGVNIAKLNNGNITTSDVENFHFQLYNQEQTYPINLGDIELCKIGDYQDRIYKDNGKWYLNKQIEKYTFTGTEDPQINTSSTNTTRCYYGYILSTNNSSIENCTGLANYLVGKLNWNPDEEGIYSNARDIVFRANKTTIGTTKTEINSWLSNHNLIYYYVLATPTNTEITDSTLISQLETLKNAYSYDTQTNITQTNDDMPFILDVEALMSLKGVLN